MSYSDANSFEKILSRCLNSDRLIDVDKRPGSVIYDALAPVCLELAEAYVKMDILESQTFLLTATGENLEKRVYDYGLIRKQATYAQRIGEFKKYQTVNDERVLVDMDIPVGSRFAVPDEKTTFQYIGDIDNYKILQCEQPGTEGNHYTGSLLPLSAISELAEANIISTYKPAEDKETDDELRTRAVEDLNNISFGGNIEDYIEKVNAIDGVGQTKVFPAWQYNGSVLLSIVDPQYNPVTQAFADSVKELVDPDATSGQGVGIAPIGHYVTITTPVEVDIDVSLSVELEEGHTIQSVTEAIEQKIAEYINQVRQSYSQYTTLAVYKARIISKVLEVEYVRNVTDVLLNGEDDDIVFVDEGLIGKQYLPKLGSVTVE